MIETQQRTKQLLGRLHTVIEPLLQQDIVSLEMVRNLEIDEAGRVRFTLLLASPAHPYRARLQQACEEALYQLPFVTDIETTLAADVLDDRRKGGLLPLTVRNTVAVASGKGGVGKSTVAANLALALSRFGASVGILDLDMYGPSMPIMLGTNEIPRANDGQLMPVRQYGLKVMSIGFLVEEEAPVIWRGPMMHQAIRQLLTDVAWGELDYLIVDLPPGTGDAQITLCQSQPLSGSVMVTTPQDVALADVVKGIAMFRDLDVPILGVVENMSHYQCPQCGHVEHLFGHGGGETISRRMGVDLLASIPLETPVREGGDSGRPAVMGQPSSAASTAFSELALQVAARLVVLNHAKPEPFRINPDLRLM
ncbi:MAG: Mrp/NBP35 family ATP-binding protein [Anaerolineae bacterium]|nr:Mrp/NBP35 family ATP-binding protein [Anaerolineae bacterium]